MIFCYFMARLMVEVEPRVLDFGVDFLSAAFLVAPLGVCQFGFVFPRDVGTLKFLPVRQGYDGLQPWVWR
jgi:hypothetical protein